MQTDAQENKIQEKDSLHQHHGYLTPDEATYANPICQMLAGLQAQKMRVDQELSEEMMKHLAKMIAKRFN